LEQGVGEAGAAVEEAPLEELEQQELDKGPGGQAVGELLLVEAAAVEIALEEGGGHAEGFLEGAVLEDLLGFKGAVGVVAGKPVAEALGEGIVIKRMLQITHGTIHHGDGVQQAVVVHELGPEEADVPGRSLHMAELRGIAGGEQRVRARQMLPLEAREPGLDRCEPRVLSPQLTRSLLAVVDGSPVEHRQQAPTSPAWHGWGC